MRRPAIGRTRRTTRRRSAAVMAVPAVRGPVQRASTRQDDCGVSRGGVTTCSKQTAPRVPSIFDSGNKSGPCFVYLMWNPRLARLGPTSRAEDSLRAFLGCGVHRFGVMRHRCGQCGDSLLVPFSCKRRLACPSCDGKRSALGSAKATKELSPKSHTGNGSSSSRSACVISFIATSGCRVSYRAFWRQPSGATMRAAPLRARSRPKCTRSSGSEADVQRRRRKRALFAEEGP